MLLPGHARPPPASQPAQHPGLRRQVEPPGQLLRLFYCTVLVCSKEIAALTDFSGYLTKLLQNHTAYACDGDHLNLQCPRHSTISVQSAFYGQDYQMCTSQQPDSQREDSLNCVAPTTLQKVLDECQNQRACHLLVNSRVFGPDLCPGSSKYLLVSFKCQPNELKNKTVCEDQELKLHCHESKFLNIYSATYGRRMQERNVCSSEAERLPPFDCLSYSALQVLSRRCYGKQRCKVLVNNYHFGSPCLPGVKKYLTVTYACVPKNILTAIDPAIANLKPTSTQEDGKHGKFYSFLSAFLFNCLVGSAFREAAKRRGPQAYDPASPVCRIIATSKVDAFQDREVELWLHLLVAGSTKALEKRAKTPNPVRSHCLRSELHPWLCIELRQLLSSGLQMQHPYCGWQTHPERAALLFVSSVCIGLVLTLCALVVRVSCTKDFRELQLGKEHLVPGSDQAEEDSEDDGEGEDSSDSEFPGEPSGFHKTSYPAYSSIEAAELAERIERREQIIQEIWMNSGLDASLPRNMAQFY
nr:protein eva-1 homolog C [Cavia porcellus]